MGPPPPSPPELSSEIASPIFETQKLLATDADGQSKRLSRLNRQDFQMRVEEFVGLLLSMPQWNFQ